MNASPLASVVDPFEAEIKALATRNRRAAFDKLAVAMSPRLRTAAGYILKDEEEAADIVQDVLIKALREDRLFEDDFHIIAWLFRVARNLCFNRLRDRRRRDSILASTPRAESAQPMQVQKVIAAETAVEMEGAFGRLTEDHREILLLRYYEEKSYAEIAEQLSIKLGTVMSRLSRARDRLLTELDDDVPMLAAG